MVNYKNGIIYYIGEPGTNNLYIGSTTNLKNRKYVHKHRCNNKDSEYYDDALYKKIRVKGWDSWVIGVLQYYPCNSRDELQALERALITNLKANLNSSLPSTNTKKYKEI